MIVTFVHTSDVLAQTILLSVWQKRDNKAFWHRSADSAAFQQRARLLRVEWGRPADFVAENQLHVLLVLRKGEHRRTLVSQH